MMHAICMFEIMKIQLLFIEIYRMYTLFISICRDNKPNTNSISDNILTDSWLIIITDSLVMSNC